MSRNANAGNIIYEVDVCGLERATRTRRLKARILLQRDNSYGAVSPHQPGEAQLSVGFRRKREAYGAEADRSSGGTFAAL